MDESEDIIVDQGSHMPAIQERFGIVTSIMKA